MKISGSFNDDVGLGVHPASQRVIRQDARDVPQCSAHGLQPVRPHPPAYTGAFSVHARVGGAAATTTVDLSKTYLDWYIRNLELNGFNIDTDHECIQTDCLQFLEHGPSDGKLYDTVILDPPTFSNSKRMRDTFSVDRDHPYLIECAAHFMAPGGEMFFSTNDRGFELDRRFLPEHLEFREISNRSIPEDFRNRKVHRAWRFREKK